MGRSQGEKVAEKLNRYYQLILSIYETLVTVNEGQE